MSQVPGTRFMQSLPLVMEPEAPSFKTGVLNRSRSSSFLRPATTGDAEDGLPHIHGSLRRKGKREEPTPFTKHRQLLREPGHRPRQPWSLPELGASRSVPTLPTVLSLPKAIGAPLGVTQPYSVCRGRMRRKATWAMTVGDPGLLRRTLQEVDAMETPEPDRELPIQDMEDELIWLERQRLEAKVGRNVGVKPQILKSRIPRACRDVYGDQEQDLIMTVFSRGDEEPVASEHRRIVADTLIKGGPGCLEKLLTAPREELLRACDNSSALTQQRCESFVSELLRLAPDFLQQDDLARHLVLRGAVEMVQAVRLGLDRLGRWEDSRNLLSSAGSWLIAGEASATVTTRPDYEDLLVVMGAEATVDEVLWGGALLGSSEPPERIRAELFLRGVKKRVISQSEIDARVRAKMLGQSIPDVQAQKADESEVAAAVLPALQAAIGLEEPLSDLEAIRVDEYCVVVLFWASTACIESLRRQLNVVSKSLPPNLCSSVTMHNPYMQRDVDGNTALHVACLNADADAIKTAIKACPDSLKARNVSGFQPFEWMLRAARRSPERVEALKVLIAAGVGDGKQKLTGGITPLMLATPEEASLFAPRCSWEDVAPLFREGQTADELLWMMRVLTETMGHPEGAEPAPTQGLAFAALQAKVEGAPPAREYELPNFWTEIQLHDLLFVPAVKGVATGVLIDEGDRVWYGWNKTAQGRVNKVWKGALSVLLEAASDPKQEAEKRLVYQGLCRTLLEATAGPDHISFDGRWPYRRQLEKLLLPLQTPIAEALCTSASVLRKQDPDGARWIFGDDGGGAVDGSSIWLEPTLLDLCSGGQRLRADFRLGSGHSGSGMAVEGEEAPSWIGEPNLVFARELALGDPSLNASATLPRRSEAIREAIHAPSLRLSASLTASSAAILQLHGLFVHRHRSLLFNTLVSRMEKVFPGEVSAIDGDFKGVWRRAENGLAEALRACDARLRHVECFHRMAVLCAVMKKAYIEFVKLAESGAEEGGYTDHAEAANALANTLITTADVRGLRRTLALSKLPVSPELPAMLRAASEFYEAIVGWPPPPSPTPAEATENEEGEEPKETEAPPAEPAAPAPEENAAEAPQPPLSDRELQVFAELPFTCKTGAFFALETAKARAVFEDVTTLRAAHEKMMKATAASDGFEVIRVQNGFAVLAGEPALPDEVEPQEVDGEVVPPPEPEPRTTPVPDPVALASSLPPHIKLWVAVGPGEKLEKNWLVVECQLHLKAFHAIGEIGELVRGVSSTPIGVQLPIPAVSALVAQAERLRNMDYLEEMRLQNRKLDATLEADFKTAREAFHEEN